MHEQPLLGFGGTRARLAMPDGSVLRYSDSGPRYSYCVARRRPATGGARSRWRGTLAFAAATIVVIGPWIIRNHISVGKWGLTEEYGSAVLIERFAYNDMTIREFFTAFPYCTPGLGDLAFDQIYGRDSMHRFVYHTPDSFFHVGRGRRDT